MIRHCDIVIIGGGSAGLCAAIRLTELGMHPVVIEAGSYPAHKVCGEFISPEAIPVLTRWGVVPEEVSQVRFYASTQTLSFPFMPYAGSLSHFTLDPQLAARARLGGAEILTQTKVVHLEAGEPLHRIALSTGELIETRLLMVATGRLPHEDSVICDWPYVGIKAHFSGLPIDRSLEMFCFDGAYLGISPVEDNRYNVACLARRDLMEDRRSSEGVICFLMSQHPLLDRYLSEGNRLIEWMDVKVPAFGCRAPPAWPNTFFIGDSMGTIPPVTGNGLSMALLGGIMAAEYAKRKDVVGFRKMWKRRFALSIFWGKCLHRMALHPFTTIQMIDWVRCFPLFGRFIFNLTR